MDTIRGEHSQIARDEAVILFPTFGYWEPGGRTWRISVRGVIFNHRRILLRKRVALRLLQRAMNVPPEEFTSDIFRSRIYPFLGAADGRRRIVVRLLDERLVLPRKSNRFGHFSGTVRIAAAESTACTQLALELGGGDDRQITGGVYLIGERGLTVISDIDDTLKHSEASCRQTLLANTFLREFRPIEGMAAVYRDWADAGAAFHYVSKSPWQLYEPLRKLFDSAGFPGGSFHLSHYRLRDQLLRRMPVARERGKLRAIRAIVEKFPRRRVVLVGDSGEHDPEIYVAIARRFPDRVAAILIRDLEGAPLSAARLAKIRLKSPAAFQLFRAAGEIESRSVVEA